jgi:UDP-N-acetylglucosamine--N-acetylmuramyl-(pentapeptide) pyrophosphoryl-undecaprenol N-acetylglucosamine transferase
MPALAIGRAALDSGLVDEVLFVGAASGLEKDIVPTYGFAIETLPVGRVRGMGMLTRATGLAGFAASVPAAIRILRRFDPQFVIGTGGFASAPTVLAGAALRKRVAVLEQNTIPGATTRVLSRVADVVCVAFPMSSGYLPSHKVVVTGNPVRPEIVAARERREKAGPPRPFTVVVLGGSQGALFLNVRVSKVLGDFAKAHPEVRIVHQAGAGRGEEVGHAYEGTPNVQVVGFVHDMAALLEGASVVVGRAGATTIAELTAIGVPAVLIPFPQAVDKHQDHNALALQQAGGGRALFQEGFSDEELRSVLEEMASVPEVLGRMERRSRAFGRPDAARAVLAAVRGERCSD